MQIIPLKKITLLITVQMCLLYCKFYAQSAVTLVQVHTISTNLNSIKIILYSLNFTPLWFTGSYARQEWKATLTVGSVVLTFLVCWLPFFVLALVRPLAPQARVPGERLIHSSLAAS